MTKYQLLNPKTMIDILGDDEDSIKEFRLLFIEQSTQCLPELRELLRMQSFDKLKLKAHYLKTSARAVGAEKSALQLYKLENSAVMHNAIESAKIIDELFLLHDELKNII
ncbi:MAG: Hpt domain-containing protein [Colwellia sp.]